jgi:hypothetical protein
VLIRSFLSNPGNHSEINSAKMKASSEQPFEALFAKTLPD